MEEVGHLLLLRVAVDVREERPRVEDRDLGLVLHGLKVERVQLLDLFGGPGLGERAREHHAQDDGHRRVMLAERRDDELQVAGGVLGFAVVLDVVCADQDHDALGIHGQHVLLQAYQDAAGRVAADAAVRGLHPREAAAYVAPALGDRVAEEDNRALVALDLAGPLRAPLEPDLLEPLGPLDRALAGEALVGRGYLQAGIGGIGGARERAKAASASAARRTGIRAFIGGADSCPSPAERKPDCFAARRTPSRSSTR